MDDTTPAPPQSPTSESPGGRGAERMRPHAHRLAWYARWVVAATVASAVVPLWSRMQYEDGVWAVVPALALVLVAGHATDVRVQRAAAAFGLIVSGYLLFVVVSAGLAVVYLDATGPDAGIGGTAALHGWQVDTPLFVLALFGSLTLVGMSAWRLFGRASSERTTPRA